MLESLPSYYEGEPLVERILQAQANELDRLAAIVDQVRDDLIPGQATDTFGLLSAWERVLRLPVAPAGVDEDARRQRVLTVLRRQSASSSTDALAVIASARAGEPFDVLRNTPEDLRDRITIPWVDGEQTTVGVFALVALIWPAHRELLMTYDEGFLADVSACDIDTF